MANLTHNGQSLIVDGRRLWIVSATLTYVGLDRSEWSSRIAAAKQAGMNCIEVIVPWRIHEPQRGKFHFKEQADLRHFLQLIIAQGLYILLRPGPHVSTQYDLGGMPSYLLDDSNLRLRQANPEFFLAVARYYGQIMAQVHDLQITAGETSSNAQGPCGIIMIQAEHQWLCHYPDQGEKYLSQLVRYLRENKCQVPISISNNLWQQVEGTIDTWKAHHHLAADLRQLRMVQPDAPRLVSQLSLAAEPNDILTQLASTLAVGGQFNIDSFAEPSFAADNAGRPLAKDSAPSSIAPVDAAGHRSPSYFAVKRVATLASHFGHVFAHAHTTFQPAAILPVDHTLAPSKNASQQISVLQQQGSQGTIIFLTGDSSSKSKAVDILLPDGQSLAVPISSGKVSWLAADIKLSGIAELTLTNLCPWAWIDRKMLVLFGPAGAKGLLKINDAPLTFDVPTAQQPPLVLEHEDLIVVILNEQQVDAAYPTSGGLIVGVDALDENDQPVTQRSSSGRKSRSGSVRIDLTGKVTPIRRSSSSVKSASPPALSSWQVAHTDKLLDGSSDAYVPLEGPQSLEALGVTQPYLWYRLSSNTTSAAKTLLASPASGGKLLFFTHGKQAGSLDAQTTSSIKLAKNNVILAVNPGRYSQGWRMHEPTGIAGDLLALKPLKLPKADIESQVVDSPLSFEAYLQDMRFEPRVFAQTISWNMTWRNKATRLFAWEAFPYRSMLLVNGKIAGVYDPLLSDHARQVSLEMETLLRPGKNVLTLALLDMHEPLKAREVAACIKQIKLYEAARNITDKAELSYAPWALPHADAFKATGGSKPKAVLQPCWYRTRFMWQAAESSLCITTAGLSSGQIYLNGNHLGRYVENAKLLLPSAWLKGDNENELLIFDEQGRSPERCKLTLR